MPKEENAWKGKYAEEEEDILKRQLFGLRRRRITEKEGTISQSGFASVPAASQGQGAGRYPRRRRMGCGG